MEDFVLIVKYGLLGLLQGITEPIPISSSGHLMIAQHLLGVQMEGLSFAVFVNFASLLAVLLIYKEDVRRLSVNGWRYLKDRSPDAKPDFKFILYLILATIPAAILGLLFSDYISDKLQGVTIIGMTLLVTGAALWLIRNLRGRKQDADLTLKDALIVGLAQAVALIPGISRSGATIVAAMGLGMKQETALRFSFFLYIPVSIGGMVLEGRELLSDPQLEQLLPAYMTAFVLTLIASYFALKWFMGIMARGNLKIFSIYCFVAGTAVLLFL